MPHRQGKGLPTRVASSAPGRDSRVEEIVVDCVL